MKRVTPAEAKQLMDEGWTYVDVRSEQEFAQGHPAGAVNIPLMHAGPGGMRPNPDFLQVAERVLPKDKPLVIGCQAGGRSAKAAEVLEKAGYTQLVDQRCGFGGTRTEAGWVASQLPVETGAPSGRAYADLSPK